MILDFHTHIGQGHRSAAHVIAHHNAYGGGKSVLLPIEPGDCTAMGAYAGMRTELAIEAVDEYGDELIPFCHVNPLAPDALDQLRRYHATGKFYGFGEHKVRLACDHPDSLDIYRLCGELGWPVLIHFEYRNYSYNFEAFETVLKTCPETTFIGHAQAWWANVSAEVPRDYLAPGYTAYPKDPVVLGVRARRHLPGPGVRQRFRAPAPHQAALGHRLPLPRWQRQLGRGKEPRVLFFPHTPTPPRVLRVRGPLRRHHLPQRPASARARRLGPGRDTYPPPW